MLKATSKKKILFKERHTSGRGGKYKKEERKKNKKGNKGTQKCCDSGLLLL